MARRNNQNEDDAEENINNDNDDTFGLPEVEYEPLKREESPPEVTAEEPAYEPPRSYHEDTVSEPDRFPDETVKDEHHEYRSTYSYMEEEDRSIWPKILGIAFIVIIALGAAYYFAIYRPKQLEAEARAKREEQRIRDEESRKKEDERLAELRRQEAEQRRLDSLNNLTKEGSVETLSERTGRYYVVVASAIDDDLLMDFANKLASNGTSCKVIPPFGKTKFYRLAVDAKDNYDEAQSKADEMKGGEFGDQLWVVRY